MGFLAPGTNKPVVLSEDDEINAIVKAHGFEKGGNYKFTPNSGVQRKDGSIINGVVSGSFPIDPANGVICLNRSDFSEKAWKRVCAAMGFKYHIHADIDTFKIKSGTVDVEISIATPIEEV